MKSPSRFWHFPKFIPNLVPGATPEQLVDFETQLGFRLPETYRALLLEHNGGAIANDVLQESHLSLLQHISGIRHNDMLRTSIIDRLPDEDRSYTQWSKVFPFDGDGHFYFCLDYRHQNLDPAITYFDIEWKVEEVHIADNFDELVMLLRKACVSKVIGIQSRLSLEELAESLQGILGLAMDLNFLQRSPKSIVFPIPSDSVSYSGRLNAILEPAQMPCGYTLDGWSYNPIFAHLLDQTDYLLPDFPEFDYYLSCPDHQIYVEILFEKLCRWDGHAALVRTDGQRIASTGYPFQYHDKG
jgi:hypothetical protein